MSNGPKYLVGGDEGTKTNHAIDAGLTVSVGSKLLAFPLCKRPRRLVQVWDQEYDRDDGCSWCNRVLDRRGG